MTADQRFSILCILLAAALGGLGAMARGLWGVSKQWVRTGTQLDNLASDIRDLVESKERDHGRLERLSERVEARVERHEQWHTNHP